VQLTLAQHQASCPGRRRTKEARDAKALQRAAGKTIRMRGGVRRFDQEEALQRARR
jgi:hypothetical protein